MHPTPRPRSAATRKAPALPTSQQRRLLPRSAGHRHVKQPRQPAAGRLAPALAPRPPPPQPLPSRPLRVLRRAPPSNLRKCQHCHRNRNYNRSRSHLCRHQPFPKHYRFHQCHHRQPTWQRWPSLTLPVPRTMECGHSTTTTNTSMPTRITSIPYHLAHHQALPRPGRTIRTSTASNDSATCRPPYRTNMRRHMRKARTLHRRKATRTHNRRSNRRTRTPSRPTIRLPLRRCLQCFDVDHLDLSRYPSPLHIHSGDQHTVVPTMHCINPPCTVYCHSDRTPSCLSISIYLSMCALVIKQQTQLVSFQLICTRI